MRHSLLEFYMKSAIERWRVAEDDSPEFKNLNKFIAEFERLITEINKTRTDKFITFEKVKTQSGERYSLHDEFLSDKTKLLNENQLFDYYVLYQFLCDSLWDVV